MQPIAAPLLQWFDANKRLLPFRQEPSAYHIWVSEIMLQQTRVAAAIPYYERFIAALPDPAALAACEPDALRKLWQGLGYYNRVNNMQKAARIVCEQYGGDLPTTTPCAVCRASVTTRRARWPALRLASPSPRWTATSCAFLRGCTTTTPTS